MKQRLTLLALAISGTVCAQTYLPINAPGYNLDVVAETVPAIGSTTGNLGAGDYVLYSADYGNALSTGNGLPNDGLITSGTRTYQLQPYGQENAVFLPPGVTDSLELVTPASYSSVSLLGFSTEGNGELLVVLIFTDGSGTVYSNLALPEWTGNAGEIASGFGRTVRTTDTPEVQANEPRMYAIDLPLSCEDQVKLLDQFLIINTTPSPTIKTVVFAVSGVAALQGTVTVTEPACNGGTDGTASVETTGGTAPFSYEWSTSPVQTTAEATGLAAGTYTVLVSDASGCDPDTLTAILDEPAPIFSGQFFAICEGENVQVGDSIYTEEGVYTNVFTSAGGCDSTVTTTIDVDSLNATIGLISTDTFMTEVDNALYQWVNCDSNYAVIPGATGQSFVAPTTGNYAVIVTRNGCTDTSECGNVVIVSVGEFGQVHVQAHPNPVSGLLTIQSSAAIETAELTDISGKTYPLAVRNDQIDLEAFAPGTYLVRLTSQEGTVSVLRIVKE